MAGDPQSNTLNRRAKATKFVATPVAVSSQVAAAKSIVLFSDGTGNSSGKLFKTNVFRLYEAVDLGPTQPKQQRQIAFYDDGVGTSTLRPLRMLQGIFGWGLRRNVLEIYSYACRNYDPDAQPLEGSGIDELGDHIYGFGFSRGAFTMRLVMGLIAHQGLIPYTNEADLDWKVRQAWKRFRRKWPRSIERLLELLGINKKSPDIPGDALRARRGTDGEPGERIYDPDLNHRPVIRFVGVWDTVAAYGGPIAEITRAIDNFLYRLSMHNFQLNPRVRRARHALALDDERDSFHPLLWDEVAEEKLRSMYSRKQAPWLDDDRLQQVWFAGMHADVGGGYPDESLSYVSLLWMLEEAHKCGLRTVDPIIDRYHGLANSFGPLHNSRAGMAGYYRYQPRRLETWMTVDPTRTLSLRDPSIRDENRKQRGLLREARVHASVIARIASGTEGYAPIVLPEDYCVVPAGGMAETKLLETTGGKPQLTKKEMAAARSNPPPLVSSRALDWLDRTDVKGAVGRAMETVWDLVWRRRLTYFATVLATLALVAIPFGLIGFLTRVPAVRAVLDAFPNLSGYVMWLPDLKEALSSLIRLAGAPLPTFLSNWFEGWARTPFWSLGVLIAIIILMRHGTKLERTVDDHARGIWHTAIPRIPPASAAVAPKNPPAPAASWIAGWRNSREYQRGVQLMKSLILPNFVIAPVMLGVLGLAIVTLAAQITNPIMEKNLSACASLARDPLTHVEVDFDASATCVGTNAMVTAGQTYQITFDVIDTWQDATYSTDPRGLKAREITWGRGYLVAPLRRAINTRYLQPVAAIRLASNGHYRGVEFVPLELELSETDATRFVGEFEAPANGTLYLFANDALAPYTRQPFYENNAGSACVTIAAAGASRAPEAARGPLCRRAALREEERLRAEAAAASAD